MTAYFYAHKVYISVEEDQVFEKKLITGEMLTRYKKRRQIKLEIPFFDKFNQFETESRPGYAEFETIINAEELRLQYFGRTAGWIITTEQPDVSPYGSPDIAPFEAIPVVLRDKEIEYLDELIDKKIVKLTLLEKYSWYAQ